jgi:hypothetical protein
VGEVAAVGVAGIGAGVAEEPAGGEGGVPGLSLDSANRTIWDPHLGEEAMNPERFGRLERFVLGRHIRRGQRYSISVEHCRSMV